MPRDVTARGTARLSVALPLVLAACATGGSAAPETPRAVDEPVEAPLVVVVENDLVPRTPVAVRFLAGAGTRTFLGTVQPARAAAFQVEDIFVGEAQLTAEEALTGETHRSRRFVAHRGERVQWSLRQNMIRVIRQ